MKAKKEFPLSKVYQLIEPGPVVMVSTSINGKPNIMTMTWHMMVDFEPPIIAIVMSSDNYSFKALQKTKECVINIPAADLVATVVSVGNCTGAKVDKFKKFQLTPLASSLVDVPMVSECYANIECKVIDAKMASKYNIFILQGVKAWIDSSKKRHRMLHHCGNGIFAVDGKMIKLNSKKK